MHIEGLPTVAMVPTCKPSAVIAAIWGFKALSIAIWIMIVARMLAKTLKVLRPDYKIMNLESLLTDWYVIEHFALAFLTMSLAVDLSGFNIVEEVVFVPVTTETLGGGTHILAIHAI